MGIMDGQKKRYEEALNKFDCGMHSEGIEILNQLVQEKYILAMRTLGHILSASSDLDSALNIYQKGFLLGDPNLSYEYLKVLIKKNDLKKAEQIIEPLVKILKNEYAYEVYLKLIVASYELENYEAFIKHSKAASDKNLAVGSFFLGMIFKLGICVAIDYEKAEMYFLKSLKDYVPIDCDLGRHTQLALIYSESKYKRFNLKKAKRHYKKALKEALQNGSYGEFFSYHNFLMTHLKRQNEDHNH